MKWRIPEPAHQMIKELTDIMLSLVQTLATSGKSAGYNGNTRGGRCQADVEAGGRTPAAASGLWLHSVRALGAGGRTLFDVRHQLGMEEAEGGKSLQIKRPLNVLMLECIVTELQARV